MQDLKLLKFPTNSAERIKANIKRLEKDLWAEDTGDYVVEILRLCQHYVEGLDEEDDESIPIALVNLSTTIILLEYYFSFE